MIIYFQKITKQKYCISIIITKQVLNLKVGNKITCLYNVSLNSVPKGFLFFFIVWVME